MTTYRTDFSDLTQQYGGKTLSHVKTSTNARRALSWDDPGSATDVEILALLSITRPTTERFHVIMRGAGSGGSETGLAVGIHYDLGVQFSQYSSGTATNFSASATIRAGQRMWVRARANGSNLRARVWMPGDAEPSSWDIDETVTVTGSGWIGLFGFDATGQAKYCDYFGVDTNGGTAPGIGDTPGSNQYSTNFSTQSVGTPSDWTARWNTGASTWSIVDSVRNVLPAEIRQAWPRQTIVHTMGDGIDYEGSTFFGRSYGTQSGTVLHQFLASPEFADGNVYAVVRSPDTQTATNSDGGFFRAAVGIRTSGVGIERRGYFFGQVHHPVTGQNRRWGFAKWNFNGSFNVLTFPYFSAENQWVSEDFYEVRIEAIANTIRGRYWPQGDYEPDTWAFEVTDSDIATGRPGLYSGYSVSTTPTTDVYLRWDVFEYTEYPIVEADLNGSFLPLTANLQAELSFARFGDLNASFAPLSAQLEAELFEPFLYSGSLAFQFASEEVIEVPVLSVTESGRTAPQARRRFSGKVSTDMMTVTGDTQDRVPRLWDIQTSYMTQSAAVDLLHELTQGGYFLASGYIVGNDVLSVSASDIRYQEGDMPDLVQLQFILRTR